MVAVWVRRPILLQHGWIRKFLLQGCVQFPVAGIKCLRVNSSFGGFMRYVEEIPQRP